MTKKFWKRFYVIAIFFPLVIFSTGCSNSELTQSNNSAENSISVASENPNTLKVPNDFPNNIPIHPGEIVVSTATGESNARTWVVEVLVDDLEQARIKSVSDLKNANFLLKEQSGINTDEYLARFSNSTYTIRLKVYLENDTGQKEVMYIVTRT